MDRTPESAPQLHEVQRQLERMLSSTLFAAAFRLSRLLKYIVEMTLAEKGGKNGTDLGEHQIGFAVLDDYRTDSSAVRTYVTNLRGRIDRYYSEFGAEDLIHIEVPPGGYRAVFSYNPQSPADKLYRRGLLQVRDFVPRKIIHSSLGLFNAAIEADPNHALAQSAKAEAELREAMYRRTIPPHNPRAAAEESALAALRLQPQLWRAHLVMGAVHCCRYQWAHAETSFDAALAIAPNRTRDHSWYAGFLLATGREKEALRLVRSRAEERPEDLSAQIALGLFLYATRRVDEAEALKRSSREFPDELAGPDRSGMCLSGTGSRGGSTCKCRTGAHDPEQPK
jgi:tetratricopeptide (TPR) repeat protein